MSDTFPTGITRAVSDVKRCQTLSHRSSTCSVRRVRHERVSDTFPQE
ncbi:MAG: hypothetical protein LBK25_04450 [Treponema sp.]|nr:hypothetical protein [Treponema sp.]